MSYGVGCRRSLDPTLLWLWRRPAATAPIRPLAWEPPYVVGAALKKVKRQKDKKKKKKVFSKAVFHLETLGDNMSPVSFLFSQGHPYSLAHDPFFHLQSKQYCIFKLSQLG